MSDYKEPKDVSEMNDEELSAYNERNSHFFAEKMLSLEEIGMGILNIPDEFRRNLKWGVSTMKLLNPTTGRIDKAPRNPHTGHRLSVTDPKGWVTFEEAVNSGYPAIGACLTAEDDYTVIDLDASPDDSQNELARKICNTFKETYSEKSYSGKGVHIILKGVNQEGRRRGNVEVYSQERYIICTGKAITKKDITFGGMPLENLINSMSVMDNPEAIPQIDDHPENENDDSIIRRMINAANGKKVTDLFTTRPGPNDDWSLLDSQLASQIAFYTKNREQAVRLFKRSKLWRGEGSANKKNGYEDPAKYESDYLIRRTFAKCWWQHSQRDEQAKAENDAAFEKLVEGSKSKGKSVSVSKVIGGEQKPSVQQPVIDEKRHYVNENVSQIPTRLPHIGMPPGLMGEIAKYVYFSAPRPIVESGIAGALTFMAGIAGRHYNINGTGLNLYSVLLAGSGRGKDAASKGPGVLVNEIADRGQLPAVEMFRGPGAIASGPALVRMMADTGEESAVPNIPSKMVFLAEFGHTLSVITGKEAKDNELKLRQALLDFYSKNSWGSTIRETAYADKQNNTAIIRAPSLSILGDTTPDILFKSVNTDVINEGFLPRFLFIEYEGGRPSPNKNMDAYSIPPDDLIDRCVTLINQVLSLKRNNQCIHITMNPEGEAVLDSFNQFADDKINADVETAEMWNRAHLMALRIAGLVAVGKNPFEPVVTKEDAIWAVQLVKRSVRTIEMRFEDGVMGLQESAEIAEMQRFVENFFEIDMKNPDKMKGIIGEDAVKNSIIPVGLIYNKMKTKTVFKRSKTGVVGASRSALRVLVEKGILYEANMREIRGLPAQISRSDLGFMKGPNYDQELRYFTRVGPDEKEMEEEGSSEGSDS